jgi:acyl-CoA synthetase (NDP forming)
MILEFYKKIAVRCSMTGKTEVKNESRKLEEQFLFCYEMPHNLATSLTEGGNDLD